MAGRTIAVGDIHGCAMAFRALVENIDLKADDRLITLGDYIDRGPKSRGVIDQLLDLERREQLIPLIGNHELMLLHAFEAEEDLDFWLQYGGQQTVDSYGGQISSIPQQHLDFVLRCRPFYETDSHLFVHANYVAHLPLAEQPEEVLYWTHLSHAIPPRHVSGKKTVVGHTPQISGELLDLGHLICIDTFCCGGGWLTALDIQDGRIWQANRDGEIRN